MGNHDVSSHTPITCELLKMQLTPSNYNIQNKMSEYKTLFPTGLIYDNFKKSIILNNNFNKQFPDNINAIVIDTTVFGIKSNLNDGYKCYDFINADESEIEMYIKIQENQKELISEYLTKPFESHIIFGHEPLVSLKCKKNKGSIKPIGEGESDDIDGTDVSDSQKNSRLKMVLLNLSKDYYSSENTYIIDKDSILEHIFNSMSDNKIIYYICADDHLMTQCIITSGTKQICQIVMGTGGTKLDTCKDRMCKGTYIIKNGPVEYIINYNDSMDNSYGYGIFEYENDTIKSLHFNIIEKSHNMSLPEPLQTTFTFKPLSRVKSLDNSKYLKYKNKYLSLKKKLII
jgi:hypothetical protein